MKIKAINSWAFVAHIENLAKLAGIENHEALKLYYRLARLEAKAHRLAERECNEANTDFEAEFNKIKTKVNSLITANWKQGRELIGLFINRDPRGYAIKIKSEQAKKLQESGYMNLYQDWGGYGILAPEF